MIYHGFYAHHRRGQTRLSKSERASGGDGLSVTAENAANCERRVTSRSSSIAKRTRCRDRHRASRDLSRKQHVSVARESWAPPSLGAESRHSHSIGGELSFRPSRRQVLAGAGASALTMSASAMPSEA